MPSTPENVVAISVRTYDQLPSVAESFLAHARQAGVVFDLDELRHHAKLTFDSATITFRWCEQSHASHGIGFSSSEREFELWFEARGWVNLTHGETQVYLQRVMRKRGDHDSEGDIAAFAETARFVGSLSPEAFGVPSKVERW